MVDSVINNTMNKIWFSGVADTSNAITDPQRYGPAYVRRMVASLAVPSGVASVARTVDPTVRETRTILDAIRARVPGLSQGLQPRRGLWGGAIVREGNVGPDLISPFPTSTGKRGLTAALR